MPGERISDLDSPWSGSAGSWADEVKDILLELQKEIWRQAERIRELEATIERNSYRLQ